MTIGMLVPDNRYIQITNASLREIAGGIAATSVEASWVSTSYRIGEIVTVPLTAWLGRVFGVRLYLLVNVSLFLVFSGVCGTASELTQIIIYRGLQGFTGGRGQPFRKPRKKCGSFYVMKPGPLQFRYGTGHTGC
jgi:MFS family permease